MTNALQPGISHGLFVLQSNLIIFPSCHMLIFLNPEPSGQDYRFVCPQRNYLYAYDFLIEGGESGFNARLGGSFQPPVEAFANRGETGSYWSSTSNPDSSQVWKYGFQKRKGVVLKDSLPPDWYFSCRCVKDVSDSK